MNDEPKHIRPGEPYPEELEDLGLKRTPLKRTPMKKRKTKRDWREAIRKRDEEGCCRNCGSTVDVQSAHVIGRRYDPKINGVYIVHADATVPLCGPGSMDCHRAYDEYRLELSDVLEPHEWEYAVREHPGGEYGAERRITGRRPE